MLSWRKKKRRPRLNTPPSHSPFLLLPLCCVVFYSGDSSTFAWDSEQSWDNKKYFAWFCRYPVRATLEIQSQVDFGNVLANSKVIAREITLVNSGSKAGEFKISYPGSKPIAIIPNQGSVPPNSVQVIKVSLQGGWKQTWSVKTYARMSWNCVVHSIHLGGTLVIYRSSTAEVRLCTGM